MLGGTTALFTRGLRLDARLLRSHLLRFLFAVLIFSGLVWTHINSNTLGAPGREFFRSITYLNVAFISLAGISFFSTAITEEKEEGTLGLLLMAGISPLGILLGKSTTRVLTALFLLLAQFPFTLLAITLGGVTIRQIFAAYFALFAYLAFLSNFALFASVYCRRSGKAGGFTCVVVAIPMILPFIGPRWIAWLSRRMAAVGADTDTGFFAAASSAIDAITNVSVLVRIDAILTTGFSESPVSLQVVLHLVSALAFFLLSWATFDSLTSDHSTEPTRLIDVPQRGKRRENGLNRVWRNYMMWKDFCFMTGGVKWWLIKFALYGIGLATVAIVLYWTTGTAISSGIGQGGEIIVGAMAIAIMVELSIYASNVFRQELRDKTFLTITLLPISTARMAYAKVAGCLLALVPAVGYFVLGALLDPASLMELLELPLVWAGIVFFVLFLHMTAYFSLIVKWGALPLALAVASLFSVGCVTPLAAIPILLVTEMTGDEAAMIMMMIYFGCVSAAALQVLIGLKLRSAAAQ